MIRLTEVRLPLDHGAGTLRDAVRQRLGVDDAALRSLSVFRRGFDARRRSAIVATYTVDCEVDDEAAVLARAAGDAQLRPTPDMRYPGAVRARGAGDHETGAAGATGEPSRRRAAGPAGHPGGADAAVGRDTAVGAPVASPIVPGARPVTTASRPIVVGFGPCGLFAALVLAQAGWAPLVIERGRAVRQRTQDTWALWRRGELDASSNVQFGEGGAGTFSDGKLWSQISDPRHLTRKVLDEFVKAGAPPEILVSSKPHIGTFRLVTMIERMRAEIEALGGEVRFGRQVVDVEIDRGGVRGVVLDDGTEIACGHVVLALGHSARDTFAQLHARGVAMHAKAFSVGFRIEHPQGWIDRARYGPQAGHPLLGAADYKLVHHAANGRAVYSFCMCPGGTVVAATSEPGRVVTNGMSQYSRNERNANAGIVVNVDPRDFRQDGRSDGPVDALDGIAFQRAWETRAFELGGGGYRAPGQRVGDFLRGRASTAFGEVEPSYRPGVTPTDLADAARPALPRYVLDAIREALPAFERRIPGFAHGDATLTGVETRTSSPLRIPRGPDRQSVNTVGLYPAGEGAGYAGGIMSAAVDGIETAEAVARSLAAASAANSRW